MVWQIKCSTCKNVTHAKNIVDLILKHRDKEGWFLCQCGEHGYIEKSFKLQEPGETWKPFLKGIITLSNSGDTYQPFIFLVSDPEDDNTYYFWFSYYKDLRKSSGKLKFGYGPGGSPVLSKANMLDLLHQLVKIRCLTQSEISDTIGN
ncbi:MAG TPA: hypothetical protein VIH42_12555 [Thermoguttaceae bacterium]